MLCKSDLMEVITIFLQVPQKWRSTTTLLSLTHSFNSNPYPCLNAVIKAYALIAQIFPPDNETVNQLISTNLPPSICDNPNCNFRPDLSDIAKLITWSDTQELGNYKDLLRKLATQWNQQIAPLYNPTSPLPHSSTKLLLIKKIKTVFRALRINGEYDDYVNTSESIQTMGCSKKPEQFGDLLALTIADFTARSNLEMSSIKGNVLILHYQMDEDWWMASSSHLTKGLVPNNHIEVFKPNLSDIARLTTWSNTRGNTKNLLCELVTQINATETIPTDDSIILPNHSTTKLILIKNTRTIVRSLKPDGEFDDYARVSENVHNINSSKQPEQPGILVALATSNFLARGNPEMSFRRGSILILHHQVSNDWWMASLPHLTTGLIPNNFIEITKKDISILDNHKQLKELQRYAASRYPPQECSGQLPPAIPSVSSDSNEIQQYFSINKPLPSREDEEEFQKALGDINKKIAQLGAITILKAERVFRTIMANKIKEHSPVHFESISRTGMIPEPFSTLRSMIQIQHLDNIRTIPITGRNPRRNPPEKLSHTEIITLTTKLTTTMLRTWIVASSGLQIRLSSQWPPRAQPQKLPRMKPLYSVSN